MARTGIDYTPDGMGMVCHVRTIRGLELQLRGTLADVEPDVIGDPQLAGNRAIVFNAWAFALHEKHRRISRAAEKVKSHEKQARVHREVAANIADLADLLGVTVATGWCSGCFEHREHRKVDFGMGTLPAFLCSACGSPTLRCAAPRCSNMATRGFGLVRVPRFCAEHRHDISGFEKAQRSMGKLENWSGFLRFEKRSLSRGTKLAGVSVVLAGAMTGVGLAFAPAIGGAIGTLVGGYTGAVATSYGLALLGGGSAAAGGLGMAGGTAVVGAVGASLGGVLGASITNAYVGEDRSFRIEKLTGGNGVPVVFASGFLTQGAGSWGGWKRIVERRYPDSPVYRVHWGSKELKHLGSLLVGGVGKAAAGQAVKQAARKATRAGAMKASPLGPGLVALDLLKNPWHTAKERANKTGVVLADLLARTDAEEYVLMGHSLGARIVVVAAQTLATKKDGPAVQSMHLLGAAIGAKGDWRSLNGVVTDRVVNYYSNNDKVLRFLYRTVQAGQVPAGLTGFNSKFPRIRDRNVSRLVNSHSDYCANVTLVQ